MDSPPTSSLRFLDTRGNEIKSPREWSEALIELPIPPDQLEHIRLLRNGEPLSLFAQLRDGRTRVLAGWPLSGTGRYRLKLETPGVTEEREIAVTPTKISQEAYATMVDELQTSLPGSVALGLQRVGALSGIELKPPEESSLAGELARLRRAVLGTAMGPGLAAAMNAIAREPHRVLEKVDRWVDTSRVRRLEPTGLVASIMRPDNIDPGSRLPRRVPDVRVELTVDVYENRLVRSYHDQVGVRLRRLAAVLTAKEALAALVEVEELLQLLARARRNARFLDDVGRLQHSPTRLTMVLLRRPDYRSLLTSYLEFRRSAYVQLDEPALEAPLENLPHLYELWGTLQVINALLVVAEQAGYQVASQRLARHIDGGLYVKVLADGEPAVELRNPATGQSALLTPQRRYSRSGNRLKSISFSQIPDITVEICNPGQPPALYLFDPKYKLRSEEDVGTDDGRPKKIDIDTMHAYRDAIRDNQHHRVVQYAAILYPGPEIRFADGIEALPARPLTPEKLNQRLQAVLAQALTRP